MYNAHCLSAAAYATRVTAMLATVFGLVGICACAGPEGSELESAYAPASSHVTGDPIELMSAAAQESLYLTAHTGGVISYEETPNFYAFVVSYEELRDRGEVPALAALEETLREIHVGAGPGLLYGNTLRDQSRWSAYDLMSEFIGQSINAASIEPPDSVDDVLRAPGAAMDLLCVGGEFDFPGIRELQDLYDAANGSIAGGVVPDVDCSPAERARAIFEETMEVASAANSYRPTAARRLAVEDSEGYRLLGAALVGSDRPGPPPSSPEATGVAGIDCVALLTTIVIIIIVAIVLYILVDVALRHFTGLGINGHWQQQKNKFWNKCNSALRDGEALLDMSDLCDCIAYDTNCPSIDLDGIGAGIEEFKRIGQD